MNLPRSVGATIPSKYAHVPPSSIVVMSNFTWLRFAWHLFTIMLHSFSLFHYFGHTTYFNFWDGGRFGAPRVDRPVLWIWGFLWGLPHLSLWVWGLKSQPAYPFPPHPTSFSSSSALPCLSCLSLPSLIHTHTIFPSPARGPG